MQNRALNLAAKSAARTGKHAPADYHFKFIAEIPLYFRALQKSKCRVSQAFAALNE